jgi:hypothetical protein
MEFVISRFNIAHFVCMLPSLVSNGPCHTITGISILRWHFTIIFLKIQYVAVTLKHLVAVDAAAASHFGVSVRSQF